MLLIVLTLTGCSFIDGEEEYQTPKEYATEQAEYIMECIVNQDKEGLKSVFSKYISETHDLDKEIDEFFEFIDGEIVSYDEPIGREGGASLAYGEYREKELNGHIENIITNKGEKYLVSFMMYQIYKVNEDKVGVKRITIVDKTDENNSMKRHIGSIE